MEYKLMIKTHVKTGLKYLCSTHKEGNKFNYYKGSGSFWLQHLKRHGSTVTSETIFKTSDAKLFKEMCKQKSIEFNVVKSEEWANKKTEEGRTGGCGWTFSHTAETKEKIKNSHIGKILSNEHKSNISNARKNKTLSEETKKKISSKLKGIKVSKETILKRIETRRKNRERMHGI